MPDRAPRAGDEAMRCDHKWYPLGVQVKDKGSAAYCTSCLALRWLQGPEWEDNRRRAAARARARGLGVEKPTWPT